MCEHEGTPVAGASSDKGRSIACGDCGGSDAPAAVRARPDIAALKLGRIDDHDIEQLDKLTVAELFAIAFECGENDPAASMMTSVYDDLVVLACARTGEQTPTRATIDRVTFRAGSRARVAAELHKRQREALLAALRQGGAR
jgi:hypothetical protein